MAFNINAIKAAVSVQDAAKEISRLVIGDTSEISSNLYTVTGNVIIVALTVRITGVINVLKSPSFILDKILGVK